MADNKARATKKVKLVALKQRREGRHRLSCDIPLRIWNNVEEAAKRHHCKYTRYVIMALMERLAKEE